MSDKIQHSVMISSDAWMRLQDYKDLYLTVVVGKFWHPWFIEKMTLRGHPRPEYFGKGGQSTVSDRVLFKDGFPLGSDDSSLDEDQDPFYTFLKKIKGSCTMVYVRESGYLSLVKIHGKILDRVDVSLQTFFRDEFVQRSIEEGFSSLAAEGDQKKDRKRDRERDREKPK